MAGKKVSAPVAEVIEHDEWGEVIEHAETTINNELPGDFIASDAPVDDADPEMFPEAVSQPIGHNGGPTLVVVGDDDALTAAAVTRLRTIVQRIERLDDDLEVLKEDRKEVFEEAKGEGFDVKIIRKVVALRKKDKAKVAEEEALIDLYQTAIEGLPG